MLGMKADIKEVDKLLMTMENKFEAEFLSLHEQINRKSNVDDIQFYRKELNFKIDKSELESFRQDYIEKLSVFDFKMKEKSQVMS